MTSPALVNREPWIDSGRGLAMVLVVLVHSIDWAANSGNSSPVLRLVHELSSSIMLPLFFSISGLLGVRALNLPWKRLLISRVFPLWWVFVIWQPIVFAYKFSAGQFLPGQNDTSLAAHLLRFAASPVRPSGELWFIWALALFFVTYKALRTLPFAVHLAVAAIISLVWSSFSGDVLGSLHRLLGPGLNGLPTYYVFFVAGVGFSGPIRERIPQIHKLWLALALAVWLATTGPLIWFHLESVPGVTFLSKALGVCAGFSLSVLLDNATFLGRIGRASMNIYLIHTALMVFIIIAFSQSGLLEPPWPGIWVLCLCGVGVLGGYVFFLTTERGRVRWSVALPPRLLRWLSG